MKRIEVSLKLQRCHPAFPPGVLWCTGGIFESFAVVILSVSEKPVTFDRGVSLKALSLDHFNILNNLPYQVDLVSVIYSSNQ